MYILHLPGMCIWNVAVCLSLSGKPTKLVHLFSKHDKLVNKEISGIRLESINSFGYNYFDGIDCTIGILQRISSVCLSARLTGDKLSTSPGGRRPTLTPTKVAGKRCYLEHSVTLLMWDFF